jgi:hypothetical protein
MLLNTAFNNNLYLKSFLNDVFSNSSFKESLLNSSTIFLCMTFAFLLSSIIFASTDCTSHCSFIPIQRSKNQNLKTKISRIIHIFSSVFIYKKRDERVTERERRKKKRETIEIKTEIRPSQLQAVITFDRKLRLKRATWSWKIYDEIYMVNCLRHYRHFQGQKTSSSNSKMHLKF